MSAPTIIFYICLSLILAGAVIGLIWWLRRRAHTGQPVGYAPYFAGWFLTWPIISYMGGQGYSGLIGFLALPVLVFTRPRRVPPYALGLVAFLGWALLSSTWSAAGGPVVTGNLLDGTFAISAAGLRIALTALACMGVIMALVSVEPGQARLSAATVRWVGVVQGVGVVITAMLMPQILIWAQPVSDARAEMPQNLLRNANSFLLLFPVLLAWAWHRPRQLWRLFAGFSLFVIGGSVVATGTSSAVIAISLMLAAMGVVGIMKRVGFSILFAVVGSYTLFAPVLMDLFVSVLRAVNAPLSLSSWSRVHAWEATSEKISEAPLLGHGLQASEKWRDKFGDQPERLAQIISDTGTDWVWQIYPIIPRHPHNMPLQIWAETGLVGASLASAAFFALAWRFRDTSSWDKISRYGAAGLIGTVLSFYSLSYSMWNEAFWASVALAAGVVILQARRRSGL